MTSPTGSSSVLPLSLQMQLEMDHLSHHFTAAKHPYSTASAQYHPQLHQVSSLTGLQQHTNPLDALVYFPEVLMRANLAESLQAVGVSSQFNFASSASSAASSLATSEQLFRHQLLQLQLQQQQQREQHSPFTAKNLIGLGLNGPPRSPVFQSLVAPTPLPALTRNNMDAKAPAAPKTNPAKTTAPASCKNQMKMAAIGRPLMAPPALLKAPENPKRRLAPIDTRCISHNMACAPMSAALAVSAPPAKRQRLLPPSTGVQKKQEAPKHAPNSLSSEELDFVEAAQRLRTSASGTNTPSVVSPEPFHNSGPWQTLLTSKALKPPPTLPL